MKRHLFPLALIAAAASLTGCLDQDQKFVLNPDGSGKLVVNMTVDTAMMGAMGGGGGLGKDMGKDIALQLLRGTKGVDVWSDLNFETAADGKSKVTGTAYFSDLNKLQMSAGDAAGGAQASTLVSRKEGDSWIIEIGLPATPAAPNPPADTPKKSPAEIKAAVAQAKAQWDASKALVAPMFESAKMGTTVVAGGTIKEATGFTKSADSTATMSFSGNKIVGAIDQLMTDPKLVEEAVANGDAMGVLRDTKRMQKVVMESMTDGKGLPKLVITPGAPAFDYAAEVAAAKAGQSEKFKALLAESSKPKDSIVRPPGGGPGKGKIVPPTPKKTGN